MFKSIQVNNGIISGGALVTVLDLGQHAFADTFIAGDQLHCSEPIFPLEVRLDTETGHLQLGYMSRAQDRYNLYDYSYTSSNSNTSRQHWDGYARHMMETFDCEGLVVEIGSNDGYLIKQFKAKAKKCLAIDSSKTMCELAAQQGLDSRNILFDYHNAENLVQDLGRAQLIMANNVFNHANDPVDFARGVAALLDPRGVFVFEVPYWAVMMRSQRFPDMIYHEHPSYFTVRSAWHTLQAAGLDIVDFDVVDYHGGSLRIVAQHHREQPMPTKVADTIAQEEDMGLFDPGFYEKLQSQLISNRDQWLDSFLELKRLNPGTKFIGVGAAAKANTWLTWHGLNKTHLHAITDASPYKQGKFTPGSRIPIVGDQEFAKYHDPYALILSWNIGQGLRNSLLNINPTVRFLSQ